MAVLQDRPLDLSCSRPIQPLSSFCEIHIAIPSLRCCAYCLPRHTRRYDHVKMTITTGFEMTTENRMAMRRTLEAVGQHRSSRRPSKQSLCLTHRQAVAVAVHRWRLFRDSITPAMFLVWSVELAPATLKSIFKRRNQPPRVAHPPQARSLS